MAKNINRIAEILGAKIVAKMPKTGGGAFGAYQAVEIVARPQERDPGDTKKSTGIQCQSDTNLNRSANEDLLPSILRNYHYSFLRFLVYNLLGLAGLIAFLAFLFFFS